MTTIEIPAIHGLNQALSRTIQNPKPGTYDSYPYDMCNFYIESLGKFASRKGLSTIIETSQYANKNQINSLVAGSPTVYTSIKSNTDNQRQKVFTIQNDVIVDQGNISSASPISERITNNEITKDVYDVVVGVYNAGLSSWAEYIGNVITASSIPSDGYAKINIKILSSDMNTYYEEETDGYLGFPVLIPSKYKNDVMFIDTTGTKLITFRYTDTDGVFSKTTYETILPNSIVPSSPSLDIVEISSNYSYITYPAVYSGSNNYIAMSKLNRATNSIDSYTLTAGLPSQVYKVSIDAIDGYAAVAYTTTDSYFKLWTVQLPSYLDYHTDVCTLSSPGAFPAIVIDGYNASIYVDNYDETSLLYAKTQEYVYALSPIPTYVSEDVHVGWIPYTKPLLTENIKHMWVSYPDPYSAYRTLALIDLTSWKPLASAFRSRSQSQKGYYKPDGSYSHLHPICYGSSDLDYYFPATVATIGNIIKRGVNPIAKTSVIAGAIAKYNLQYDSKLLKYNNQIYGDGALPWHYDFDNPPCELGFHFPVLPGGIRTDGYGTYGTNPGTWDYVLTYVYLDANGDLHRSTPSRTITVTAYDGYCPVIYNPINELLTYKNNVATEIWRTTELGSIFYLVTTISNTTESYSDLVTDTGLQIGTRQILPQSTGELPHIPPVNTTGLCIANNKLVYGTQNSISVSFTKEKYEGFHFADETSFNLKIEVAPTVLGVEELNSNIIVLSDNGTYQISGDVDRRGQGSWNNFKINNIPSRYRKSITKSKDAVYTLSNITDSQSGSSSIIKITNQNYDIIGNKLKSGEIVVGGDVWATYDEISNFVYIPSNRSVVIIDNNYDEIYRYEFTPPTSFNSVFYLLGLSTFEGNLYVYGYLSTIYGEQPEVLKMNSTDGYDTFYLGGIAVPTVKAPISSYIDFGDIRTNGLFGYQKINKIEAMIQQPYSAYSNQQLSATLYMDLKGSQFQLNKINSNDEILINSADTDFNYNERILQWNNKYGKCNAARLKLTIYGGAFKYYGIGITIDDIPDFQRMEPNNRI